MSRFTECPLCRNHFHVLLIQNHAAECNGALSATEVVCNNESNIRNGSSSSNKSSRSPYLHRTANHSAINGPFEVPVPVGHGQKRREANKGVNRPKKQVKTSWGSLRSPTTAEIKGWKRRSLAFDKPQSEFQYLVVLDFEWTCDNTRPVRPYSEIIEFPSVLVRTSPRPAQVVDQFQVN